MIRQFNLEDLNDILIQPDVPLDDNDNDEAYEEDFENENVSKASSPSMRQDPYNNNTTYNNSINDTYANDTFLSEHESAEFTAISSPEASISKGNTVPHTTTDGRQEELLHQPPNPTYTSGKETLDDDVNKESSNYSDEEYSMDERSSALNMDQRLSVISPFQQFDEAYPHDKYAAIIKPLQPPPAVPVINVKNKKTNYKDSRKFSAIESVEASHVPGVPKYASKKETASDGGLGEAEIRSIVESVLSAQDAKMDGNKGISGSSSSGDNLSAAPGAGGVQAPQVYSIEDIMRKAIHLEAPRLRPDVKYNADFPVVKDHHDHRILISKKENKNDQEEVPETVQIDERTKPTKAEPRAIYRESAQRSNALAATFDREIKSATYLMTGKDPVELTLKCDEIYSNFLSDLISACRKQAALSVSSEEMAMHRVLAEQMAVLYTDRDQIDNIRSKMIWAAREVSLYKTEKDAMNSTKTQTRSSANSNDKNRSSSTKNRASNPSVNTKQVQSSQRHIQKRR